MADKSLTSKDLLDKLKKNASKAGAKVEYYAPTNHIMPIIQP